MVAMFFDVSSIFHGPVTSPSSANKLAFEVITPFGKPVVPEVYSWNAVSVIAVATFGSTESCAPFQSV